MKVKVSFHTQMTKKEKLFLGSLMKQLFAIYTAEGIKLLVGDLPSCGLVCYLHTYLVQHIDIHLWVLHLFNILTIKK